MESKELQSYRVQLTDIATLFTSELTGSSLLCRGVVSSSHRRSTPPASFQVTVSWQFRRHSATVAE